MKLCKSTYYYQLSIEGKTKLPVNNAGRPFVGYSVNSKGEKVCDAAIKDQIMEAIQDEAFFYGYHKITIYLRKRMKLIINHKKVYRLCKELQILKKQRVMKPAVRSRISVNREIRSSNRLWEADIKYGYILGEDKFFFVLSIIDVFDRSIVDYHMGYSCAGSDASSLLRRALMRRNLFNYMEKPIIRTDNGPQFISNVFEESCGEIGVYHERIPSKTPNKNAHIESFHRIMEDECMAVYEFESYKDAYQQIASFMKRYNTCRIHSSIKYMSPNEFYAQYIGQEVEGMVIRL